MIQKNLIRLKDHLRGLGSELANISASWNSHHLGKVFEVFLRSRLKVCFLDNEHL